MTIYSEFSNWKWWLSIAMLNYQRVSHIELFDWVGGTLLFSDRPIYIYSAVLLIIEAAQKDQKVPASLDPNTNPYHINSYCWLYTPNKTTFYSYISYNSWWSTPPKVKPPIVSLLKSPSRSLLVVHPWVTQPLGSTLVVRRIWNSSHMFRLVSTFSPWDLHV